MDPATTFAYQWYVDTGDDTLKIRNAANDGYVNVSTVGGIGTANFGLAPLSGATFTGDVILNTTTALQLPAGTTAQRPDPAANGDIRYNSTPQVLRLSGAWGAIGGVQLVVDLTLFYENSLTVTTSYTITASSGAHAVGPLEIESGADLLCRYICPRYQLTMAITIDGDNGISGVNGTATTPALQGTDSNTGIVFGTDEVRLQLAAAPGNG